jgi:hypothetical protein
VTDFQMVHGFEEVWRPPARPRRVITPNLLHGGSSGAGQDIRARLARIANRAPEVMVKVTGRSRDPGHLRAHLDYISRNGKLDLETQDGAIIGGRSGVADLADGWSAEQLADPRSRANAPFNHNLVLSMPEGTDPVRLRDAARAFAEDMFAGRHDYVFTLHTDTPRPHVHLSICSRDHAGERLNPRKADLEQWRQVFAEKLRQRGVEAEATPRRARGVTRKPVRGPLRRMQDRHAAGQGGMARVRRSAYQEAAKAAFGTTERPVWESRTADRQAKVRGLYLAQAQLLQRSPDPTDRTLGARVEAFVRSMPQPDSQRLALARELRAAARRHDGPSRDRTR